MGPRIAVAAAKRRGALVVLIAAGLVTLGLLTVFAIELSNTQAKSKSDVKARVHERAVLAAALVDSLFKTTLQQIPQDEARYGRRVVSAATMNASGQQNVYVALLDRTGRVLASSQGFTPQAHTDLRRSAALALLHAGHSYGLGNLLPYDRTGVVNFAVAFPTRYGRRILLSGISPPVLGGFLGGELRRIPGVKGAHNYVLDGDNTVLASNYPARPVGYRFDSRGRYRRSVAPRAIGTGSTTTRSESATPPGGSCWLRPMAPCSPAYLASGSGCRG